MSTIYGTPIDFMNIHQLRIIAADLHIARNLGVSAATLITAIKAA